MKVSTVANAITLAVPARK